MWAARSLDSEVVKLKSDGNFAAPDAGTLCTKPCVGIFFVDVSCGIPAVHHRVPVLYLLLGVLFVYWHKLCQFGVFAPVSRSVAFNVRRHIETLC